jgi:quercetin dioxygenase-like cupin family protein
VRIFICFVFLVGAGTSIAQHHPTKLSPLSFTAVCSEFLSDSLQDYKLEATIMTMSPGIADTVSHRHDCDLFGFVLEGEIQIGLEHKTPVTYFAGQMFFEKRNILHSLARNTLKNLSTRILLISVIKNGRKGYLSAYPEDHSK